MRFEKTSSKAVDFEWIRDNEEREYRLSSETSRDIGREMEIEADKINKLLSQIDLDDDLPDLNQQKSINSKFKPVERKPIVENKSIDDEEIRKMVASILNDEEEDKLIR